ncbi:MAG TPA: NADH:flavin oxidoreductase [Candidatus Binatia bacterium]|nr:NADH:flavin oxidoreductase [Candidatus Binatia bacterium]
MPELFSRLQVKNLDFKNRIVMPPMATERSGPDGLVKEESLAYYEELAGRGMALLIVEHNCVSAQGMVSPGQMSIASGQTLPGHRRLSQAVRRQDALVALQINYAGSNRQETIPGPCLGASPVPHPVTGLTPLEMSEKQIAEIIGAFGSAAARGKEAGYDLVEIHSAHGYLLSQFLSPLTNQRRDRYGGDPARRRRLLMEVIEEVRARVGSDYPLLVRLGVSDTPPGMALHSGGLTLADGVAAAAATAAAGIDILDISGGLCGSRPAGLSGEAYFLPWLEEIRLAVTLPLLITGGITRAETAAAIIAHGRADLVGIGRALAADRSWVRRAETVGTP